MVTDIWTALKDALGTGEGTLAAGEMAVRVPLVYATALMFVRLGDKRFMGKNTALDLILGIVVGSVLSRAITGNSPFLPTIVAGGVLVALHSLLGLLAFHSRWFGHLVKGQPRVLIRQGELQRDQMRKSRITQNDLDEALHSAGCGLEVGQVQEARLERNGQISVIAQPSRPSPIVVEISVQAGVQTVRLELK